MRHPCFSIFGTSFNICRKLLQIAFMGMAFYAPSQNKPLADSLEAVLNQGEYHGLDRLSLLNQMIKVQSNPEKALYYSELLLKEAESLNAEEFLYDGYLNKGNALTLKGDLSQALQAYYKSEQLAGNGVNSSYNLGKVYVSMAGVYSAMGNRDNTIRFYKKAISLLKDSRDSILYATVLENLGDEYSLYLQKPDSALILFEQSGLIWNALGHDLGIAYNKGNTGLAYAKLGEVDVAEKFMSEAITKLEILEDYYPIAVYLTYMSDIYAKKEAWDTAFTYALRSLRLAKQYGLKEQISDAYLKLSELYESTGYEGAALKYYKDYVAFRDSVRNISSVQEMGELRTKHEVAQKQAEVDLLNAQRKTQWIIVAAVVSALVLLGIIAFGLYRRNRYIRATNRIIEMEKDKSDSLLKNILPESTALELKLNGKVKAKEFKSVTVLFTDFIAFTRISEELSAESLVSTVDFYFSAFDAIIQKHGLEKIKTIGDSYMCAGGIPYPHTDHPRQTLEAAFEILDFVNKAKNDQNSPACFDVRIGINTGPVVAGVVGTRKFAYDIWGDTVNIAARMESNSLPGKINISETTYRLIKPWFDCEFRGDMDVKNKGFMKMYFVLAPKNAMAVTC